jgi:hypothetical protein
MIRGALVKGPHVFAAAGQPVREAPGRGRLARADHALDQDQPRAATAYAGPAAPGGGREAAGQPLEGVRHPQAGGVVEPLADDHHPDREAVRPGPPGR